MNHLRNGRFSSASFTDDKNRSVRKSNALNLATYLDNRRAVTY